MRDGFPAELAAKASAARSTLARQRLRVGPAARPLHATGECALKRAVAATSSPRIGAPCGAGAPPRSLFSDLRRATTRESVCGAVVNYGGHFGSQADAALFTRRHHTGEFGAKCPNVCRHTKRLALPYPRKLGDKVTSGEEVTN